MIERALSRVIRLYQVALSPYFGHQCRFSPTCSEYALQALKRYGVWRGLALGFRRVLRCNPFHPGGIDPLH